MESKSLKQKALVVQLVGFAILLLGTRGFFIFRGTPLYLPSLIAAIVIFAACLFKGGAMSRRAKELEKRQAN